MQSQQVNHNMASLISYIMEGETNLAIAEVNRQIEAGVDRKEIILEAIQKAMELLGSKCTAEQFNLLEIMLAGRTATLIMKELYPDANGAPSTKGTVVIATLEGDVHDIGKNIVKIILITQGYKVIDCGKNCPIQTIVDAAETENAIAVLVSGLITNVIPQVKVVKQALADNNLSDIKVFAGGAALKQFTAESLNVDNVGETAFDVLRFLESEV
ncbi:putative cobalamin binding protein [Candidatus Desulfosporosinus infrequens]|uniref:Putative cobalamin binding protein n=1 Tax=Candidatus Desulfosporosinus infrequens TaxID=2043169 RepID=A0A2U3KXA2_9FIRM|nr:putative cobalamin binding protein [Candidatus Desulfosporosinus infrequens]